MISHTRRRNFSFPVLPSLNLQTSISNVGRCQFVLQFTMPESMLSIVSSWFANTFIIPQLLSHTQIFRDFCCTMTCFTVILVSSETWFRNPLGNNFRAVLHTRFIDIYNFVILFHEILPNFHDQITMSETSLSIMCWMKLHSLSNDLITGFKRLVFMTDVCWYKNLTCCLIQTIYWLLLSWMSHLVWFLWCWT